MKAGHEITKPRKRHLDSLVSCFRVFVAAFVTFGCASIVSAADHYALIVTGASGGPEYAQKYDEWRSSLATILRVRFGYPDDHVLVLAENGVPGIKQANRDNVRGAFAALRQRVSKDDVLLVVLIGHGTAAEGPDGSEAKFNLVGPDLSATEWADLVRPIAGRVVFVDTASGSSPFLRKVAARGRIVVTSADSTSQQYETIFPEFFIEAFTAGAADADKDGRVSIWEAFNYASARVREWYQKQGRLQTERPLLDDTGAGVGREAQSPGSDGRVAQFTYLDRDQPRSVPADGELAALLKRRAQLQSDIDQLRARKPEIPPDRYDAQMEQLLLELATIDAQIRARR
jgi:hypothetical protein